ncbi:cation:proton antiporter [Mycobacterium pinniadriaticum]
MVGPLLASVPRLRIPVVIGELAVGLLIGRTGFGIVDAADPTFSLLADIGFALVMFVVGTHVPIRDVTLRSSIPGAALRAVLVGAVATGFAIGLATVFHTGHAAVYAVLMFSSSAALVLPVIQSLGIDGPSVKSVTAQIAIADATSIILLPLVIDPDRAVTAAIGAVLIALCAALLFGALWGFDRWGLRKRLHHFSEDNEFALELRISLIVLFALAALAVTTHVSIMLAGFALGLAVKAAGEPRRLARQLFGITEGLFSPLFFVWLGASLRVRELGDDPAYILLGVGLGVGAVLAHCVAAQLGVPVAAATLGTQKDLLSPGEPSALMLGALLTIGVTSVASVAAARRNREQPTPPAA